MTLSLASVILISSLILYSYYGFVVATQAMTRAMSHSHNWQILTAGLATPVS